MKLSKKDILTMKYDYDECPTVEFIRLDVVCEVVKEIQISQNETLKEYLHNGKSKSYNDKLEFQEAMVNIIEEKFGEVLE